MADCPNHKDVCVCVCVYVYTCVLCVCFVRACVCVCVCVRDDRYRTRGQTGAPPVRAVRFVPNYGAAARCWGCFWGCLGKNPWQELWTNKQMQQRHTPLKLISAGGIRMEPATLLLHLWGRGRGGHMLKGNRIKGPRLASNC